MKRDIHQQATKSMFTRLTPEERERERRERDRRNHHYQAAISCFLRALPQGKNPTATQVKKAADGACGSASLFMLTYERGTR